MPGNMRDGEPEKKVLRLHHVRVEPSEAYDAGLFLESMELAAGQLAMIKVQTLQTNIPFADVASGITDPGSGGSAVFEDCDWRGVSSERALDLRGRIGRVFGRSSWLSNLDIDENVMLPLRHHSRRPYGEIAREAEALARAFGMEGLPRTRPAGPGRAERRRAEWVRAFLGTPSLILLERPMLDADSRWLPLLAAQVRTARRRGAAVVWITHGGPLWSSSDLIPTFRYVLKDSMLVLSSAE